MQYVKYLIGFLAIFLVGCNQPESNPELRDPIFLELDKQIKQVETELASEKNKMNDYRDQLLSVTPQTGAIKYARKRYYESSAKVEKLRQRRDYLIIHQKSRSYSDHYEYLKAYYDEKSWPDPTEYPRYMAQIKREQASRAWDVKERIESAKPKERKPSGHGEEHSSEHGE